LIWQFFYNYLVVVKLELWIIHLRLKSEKTVHVYGSFGPIALMSIGLPSSMTLLRVG
jgi:hypothetical protein